MLFGVLLKTQVLHKEEWNIHALGVLLLAMNGAVVVFVMLTLILLCYQNARSSREEQKKKVALTKSKFTRAFASLKIGDTGGGINSSTKVIPVGNERMIHVEEEDQQATGDYYQVMMARAPGRGTGGKGKDENDLRSWGMDASK